MTTAKPPKETHHLVRTLGVLSVAAAGIIAILASESPPMISTPANYLTLSYEIRTEPDPAALLADVASNSGRVRHHLTPSRCELDADFSVPATEPELDFSGQPGQSGANVTIDGVNFTPKNPPTSACRTITNFNVTLGNLGVVLDLNTPVNVSSASLIANGAGLPTDASFTTSGGFFEGQLLSFNSADGYFTGDFEFVAIGPNDFVFLATGTFGSD